MPPVIYDGHSLCFLLAMQRNTRKNIVCQLKTVGIFTFAILLWMAGPAARALTFTAQNFELQFPPGWRPVTPTPVGALEALQSPDHSKVVVLDASELSPSERAGGIGEALAGAKENYVQHGWPMDPEQSLTVNGVPFRFFVSHQTAACTMATYAAVAGHEIYIFGLIYKKGDASKDSELQTILQSFQLITPAEIPRSTDVSGSVSNDAAFQMGRVLGMLLVLAVFIAVPICAVVLFVRFVFFRKKTSSAGSVPPPLPTQ